MRPMLLTLAALAGGCASTWDDVSSRKFRGDPFGTVFKKEDPLTVLRTPGATGDARARAFENLAEPGGADQDAVVQMLSDAATADPSPWVRVCAIDALGRFHDPRTAEVLANAYHKAAGAPPGQVPVPNPIEQAGLRRGAGAQDASPGKLFGPQGFPADQVANIRGRALDALAKSNKPEAVQFLARVATGQDAPADDPAAADQVRQRAVKGLGQMRTKEAVVALSTILTETQAKDVALAGLAHTGLKSLTGKNLPADPAQWQGVVQAGFEVVPEPSGVVRALGGG